MNHLLQDGKTAEELIGKGIGYTYNDIIILPGHIDFGINEINLGTKITKIYIIKNSNY